MVELCPIFLHGALLLARNARNVALSFDFSRRRKIHLTFEDDWKDCLWQSLSMKSWDRILDLSSASLLSSSTFAPWLSCLCQNIHRCHSMSSLVGSPCRIWSWCCILCKQLQLPKSLIFQTGENWCVSFQVSVSAGCIVWHSPRPTSRCRSSQQVLLPSLLFLSIFLMPINFIQ